MKRKAGEWHPLFQIIATIAFPLVYSVYLGVAESARDIAIELAKRKKPGRHTIDLAGRMETELAGARLARGVDAGGRPPQRAVGRHHQPGDDRPAARRRGTPSPRSSTPWRWPAAPASTARPAWSGRFRDIQAARYHPLQAGPQAEYAGAMALGLPIEQVF